MKHDDRGNPQVYEGILQSGHWRHSTLGCKSLIPFLGDKLAAQQKKQWIA
ncbi:hypothetical protein SAMN05216428_11152 [Nitrosospira sp. Nsp11]|nr:hypothetical protein SAMN05216428_11152 [Nitrosospira sp. Nsp11]